MNTSRLVLLIVALSIAAICVAAVSPQDNAEQIADPDFNPDNRETDIQSH